jgi:alkanesulfonate monooxygenase SsuD/methylene tetrahydromethanopterin reductase-like flavin-dependent oxidoreductase (luciferase family)
MRDFWIEADSVPAYRAGWIFDHFVPQTGWRNHEVLVDERGPCFEAWTSLAYLAALTSRVRVGTLVTSITHRHPAVLAKMITSLDHMSGGRLEVGIGAGWNEPEHAQFGLLYPPLAERFDRLEEYLEILALLLSDHETVTYSGRFYQPNNAFCDPPAAQRPRPPLTVGGKGPRRALPIVARWADHWNYPGGALAEFVQARERLSGLCAEGGRSIDDLDISVQLKFEGDERWVRSANEFAEAGAQHLVIRFTPPLSPADLIAVAERACSEFDIQTS